MFGDVVEDEERGIRPLADADGERVDGDAAREFGSRGRHPFERHGGLAALDDLEDEAADLLRDFRKIHLPRGHAIGRDETERGGICVEHAAV